MTLSTQSSSKLYEQDFCLWAETMANLLKTRQLDQLDYENLIEEIEFMGGSQRSALRSDLKQVLIHLLKWVYQPSKRSDSWRYSLIEHRDRLEEAFEDSPSLKNYFDEVLEAVYVKARRNAAKETQLNINQFPETLPFTKEQILDMDYLPE